MFAQKGRVFDHPKNAQLARRSIAGKVHRVARETIRVAPWDVQTAEPRFRHIGSLYQELDRARRIGNLPGRSQGIGRAPSPIESLSAPIQTAAGSRLFAHR